MAVKCGLLHYGNKHNKLKVSDKVLKRIYELQKAKVTWTRSPRERLHDFYTSLQ
jgi:hypothetical protein